VCSLLLYSFPKIYPYHAGSTTGAREYTKMHSTLKYIFLFTFIAYAIPTNYQHSLSSAAPPPGPITLKQARLLLDHEYLPFEAGYGVTSNGMQHVAASTYMRGVTSDMIEWFFGWANTTEDYLFWHPRDHVALTFIPPKNPGPSLSSRYIGGSHLADEKIGGDLMSFNITFRSPEAYFGSTWKQDFKAKRYTTAICARVALYDHIVKSNFNVGHVIHLIHQEADGVRMRSRFWLGDLDTPIPGLSGSGIIPESTTKGLVKHCPEEMSILATVLPRLWRENSEEGKKGVQTGYEKTDMKSKTYQGPAGVKI
jgi:DAPG hydrolase PhiG domain